MKSTFFSLINSGIFCEDSFHPLTCKKIYNAVVIPKALYGCENWSALTPAELFTLKGAHRFSIKCMHSLNMHTRTDTALGLLALEVEIDIRKFVLFGQLCRLNSNCWAKTMVLNRLTSFKINQSKQIGFIVEIDLLLQKYEPFSFLISPRRSFSWQVCLETHDQSQSTRTCKVRLVRKSFQSRILWI